MSDEKKHLEKVTFRTNIPNTLVFRYGQAKEIDPPKDHQDWGPSYLFGVTEGSEQKSLFASATLHALIHYAGLKRDDTVVITKEDDPADGRRNIWSVKIGDREARQDRDLEQAFEKLRAQEEGQDGPGEAQGETRPDTGADGGSQQGDPSASAQTAQPAQTQELTPEAALNRVFLDQVTLLSRCYDAGIRLLRAKGEEIGCPFTNRDFGAAAATLFIEMNKKIYHMGLRIAAKDREKTLGILGVKPPSPSDNGRSSAQEPPDDKTPQSEAQSDLETEVAAVMEMAGQYEVPLSEILDWVSYTTDHPSSSLEAAIEAMLGNETDMMRMKAFVQTWKPPAAQSQDLPESSLQAVREALPEDDLPL